MKKSLFLPILSTALLALSGCSSTKVLNFSCTDPSVSIYSNEEYLGHTLVKYSFPPGANSVVISGEIDGETVYKRTFYKDSWKNNSLIDINVKQDMNYSSGQKKASTY